MTGRTMPSVSPREGSMKRSTIALLALVAAAMTLFAVHAVGAAQPLKK